MTLASAHGDAKQLINTSTEDDEVEGAVVDGQ